MPRTFWHWLTVACFIVGIAAMPAWASAADASAEPLRVGTTSAPPFAIKDADGNWYGISIELWRAIAADLEIAFELEERPFQDLIADVADGGLDVSVAALTITENREEQVDFSHPFFTTGLGIAVPASARGGWINALKGFFSLEFLAVLLLLAAVLVLAGFGVWLFERRGNSEMFSRHARRGIGDGFWWAAVTMTTVGYGDKAPKTAGGRLVGLVWMFTSVIIISSFTAAITSSLTVGKLGSRIDSFDDLANVRVGTVVGSTAAQVLDENIIEFREVENSRAGLQQLANGELDAFVQDQPILQYLARTQFAERVRVLNVTYTRQDYGIALPSGSDLREPINRALLEFISGQEWLVLNQRYLGR